MTDMPEDSVDKAIRRETIARYVEIQSFPRHFGTPAQSRVQGFPDLFAEFDRHPGETQFLSVYGFPRGHPSKGNTPWVDTLFVDFDIDPSSAYATFGHPDDWPAAIEELLMPVSEIASHLVSKGVAGYWRAVLSGHKGVHLYLDFERLSMEDHPEAIKYALGGLVDDLLARFEEVTLLPVEPFIDVDSSNLAQMARIPNSLHPTATERFGEPRFCVPVTMDELATIEVDDYIRYTREPRIPDDWKRVNNEVATEQLNNMLTQWATGIRSSSPSARGTGSTDREKILWYKLKHGLVWGDEEFQAHRFPSNHPQVSEFDHPAADEAPRPEYPDDYQEPIGESMDDYWKFINRPCIQAYANRTDVFDYGSASNAMEVYVMSHLADAGVPYDLLVDFFADKHRFTVPETTKRLNIVIGNEYDPRSCESVLTRGGKDIFCLQGDCDLYNREVKYDE